MYIWSWVLCAVFFVGAFGAGGGLGSAGAPTALTVGVVKARRQAARAKADSQENALRKLAEQHEQGQLTDDEFESQKNQLLSS